MGAPSIGGGAPFSWWIKSIPMQINPSPKNLTHLHYSCCFMRARTRRSTIQRSFSAVCRPSSSSSPLPGCLHHGDIGTSVAASIIVTPDFPKKTKCISYVRQDQVYTHMIDVMSEISINSNIIVQELNYYIISLLHSDVRLEGLYND
jgi:hypothetical protein